jgi:hypothetical protein
MSDFDAEDSSRSVLSKADEFLRRRRAQQGIPVEEHPSIGPVTQASLAAGDDIPVLTDVVSDASGLAEASPDSVGRKDFNAEIAREMDAWLDENLPQVVFHALDGITDRLIYRIHESARADLLPRLKRTLSEQGDDTDNQ